MEKLLLHACCAPCSIYPTEHLREINKEFSVYFFNPNIHPYKEFKQRLKTLREFCELEKLNLVVDKNYDLESFLSGALAEPIKRCFYCYKVRMDQVAAFAAGNGYTHFTTTLLGSTYQDHEAIKQACVSAANDFQVSFLYIDFRAGFKYTTEESIRRQMYRQSYCGCIFSERDRYEKRKNKVTVD